LPEQQHLWSIFGYEEFVSIAEHGAPPSPDHLIVDEAHYCKNPQAKRTRAALKLANRSPRVWFLSGTPMPNHPGELYPVFRAVWPDLIPEGIGGYLAWLDRFCHWTTNDYGSVKVYGAKNTALLRDMLDKIMLIRTAEDVALDLPEIRFEEMRVTVTEDLPDADEAAVLQAVRRGEQSKSTSELRHALGVEKAKAVVPVLLDELQDTTHKLVVMAYHRKALDILENALPGSTRVDGSTPDLTRETAIRRFQEPGGPRIFLGQITAAGIGVTLTAASEMVILEPSWSPADNQQAAKRIHRISQDRPCRVRMVYAPNTLDEGIQRVVSRKLKMTGEIVHSYTR
jgi:SWI/SNF-related matrix-associated actin-dependent regulator 1 of chromatin subfamily A